MRPTRYSFDGPLNLTVYRSGQKRELWGRTADISEGGVAATLSESLEVGEIAVLRVEIAKKTMSLRAAVRYSRGHFCGFEFLAMSLDQREAIKSLCEHLRPIPVINPNREPRSC